MSKARVETATCAIGIDVGGTKIAGGLVSFPEGRVLSRRRTATRADRGGDPVLADVMSMVHDLRADASRLGLIPQGVGIGVAELVDRDGRIVSQATIGWCHRPIDREVESAISLVTRLDADVRAAARGEAYLGAGRQRSPFLYVTVGTGISSALVIDCIPFQGARGLTGTFASSPMLIADDHGQFVSGPPLEDFAAGPALAARLAARRPGFDGSAKEVLELADSGDERAAEVVESAGRALGAAIGQIVNILDPAAVVIGGGLGLAEGLYRSAIDQAVRAHVWSEYHRSIPICSAQLGDDAGWIGAACALIDDGAIVQRE